MSEPFWLEDPSQLVARFDFLPCSTDTWQEKLNTVTRLVILIAVVGALLKWKNWLMFLIVCIVLIVLAYLLNSSNSPYFNINSQYDEMSAPHRTYIPNHSHGFTHPGFDDKGNRHKKIKPTPKRRQKSAYEHARESLLSGIEVDETARDRQNLFGSIL